jgi:hypothetical protein
LFARENKLNSTWYKKFFSSIGWSGVLFFISRKAKRIHVPRQQPYDCPSISGFQPRFPILSKRIGVLDCSHVAILLVFSAVAARGQQSFDPLRRNSTEQSVIVGQLTGQNDYREIEMTTREGTFRVYGHGNTRPFEMLEGNAERLVIAFKPTATNVIDMADRSRARPQQVIYRFFRTERSLITAIILDEIDFAVLESEASAEEIQKATRNYQILPLRAPTYSVEMICYNLAHPLLRERSLRQALSYAIRKEEIKHRFLQEKADIATAPLQPESRFFPPGINEYSYNPQKALALLNAAGWRDTNRDRILDRNGEPLRFRIYYDESTHLKEQIIRHLKIGWNEIGIDVIPIPLSAARINDYLRSGDFDSVLRSYRFEESITSLENFFNFGSSSSFLNYDNPRLQQAFQNAKVYKGTEAFRPIMQRIVKIINEDQPVSFLYHPWLTIYVINYAKFQDYQDRNGLLKPFEEWTLRIRP